MRSILLAAKQTQVLAVAAIIVALAPYAWGGTTYKVLHSFGSGSDGSLPSGPLARDKQGNLYGATFGGDTGCKGSGSGGTVFELRQPTADGAKAYCTVLLASGSMVSLTAV